MKFKSSLALVLIIVFSSSFYPVTTKSIQVLNLAILQVKGISEEVGTFGYIKSPFLKDRNFYKQGMAFDSRGNLYITDSGDCQIEVFDENLKPLRHFGGIGSGDGQFQYLVDLKIDEDQIFTLDLILGRIQVFDLQGTFLYKFDTSSLEDTKITYPTGFAISLHKNIFVIDLFNGMKQFDRKGLFVRTIEGPITDTLLEVGIDKLFEGSYILFEDVKSDELGNIYVLLNQVDERYFLGGAAHIIVLNPEGHTLMKDINKSAFDLSSNETPNSCFALEGDYLYCAAWNPGQFEPYDGLIEKCFRIKFELNPVGFPDRNQEQIFYHDKYSDSGVEIQSPTAFLIRNEILYFLDSQQNKIVKISLKGEILDTYLSPQRLFGKLSGITGDNQGNIFVADRGRGEIDTINKNLEITNKIGKPGNPDLLPDIGEFCHPNSFAWDSKGFLYCSDRWYGCIQVFDPDLKPFYRIYPLNRLYHATGLFIDVTGQLWLYDSYNEAMYAFDISRIQEKVVKVVTIFNTKDIWFESFAMNKNGYFLIPQQNDEILVELDITGQIVKKYQNPAPSEGKEELILSRTICQDENLNFLLADEWTGAIWKFDPTLKSIWSEKLNWFGIQSFWVSDDGIIYAVDQAHSLILKIRDKSFVEKVPTTLSLDPFPESTYQEKVIIKGKTDPGCTLIIGDSEVLIDQNGLFEWELTLQLGENKWNIVSSHPEKKKTTKEIKITRKQSIEIHMKLDSALITLNEKEQVLEAPIFRDKQSNRIFAPARILVEAIHGVIEWKADEQKITIHLDKIELILKLGDPYAILNGKKIPIDPINEENKSFKVVPKIVNERLFLPLRFVSEQIGYHVEWIDKTKEIFLTYPDLQSLKSLKTRRQDEITSIGKILGISMSDSHCAIFPIDNQKTIVLISSNVPYDDNYQSTGFVKLDAKGNVVKSHVLNTRFDKAIRLANQQLLLVEGRSAKNEFDKKSKNALHLTWLSEECEILQSKLLVYEYKYFYISYIYSVFEKENGDFQIQMTLSTNEVGNISDDIVTLVLNRDGLLKETIVLPENKFEVSQQGICSVYLNNPGKDPEDDSEEDTGKRKISLFDFDGNTIWTKNMILPNPDTNQKLVETTLFWLSDGSLLLSTIVRDNKCYLTRIDKDGNVVWGTKLSVSASNWFYYPITPLLLPNGDLVCSFDMQSEESPYDLMPVIIIDKDGSLKKTFELDPKCYQFYLTIASGYENDFWLSGKTYEYAFGLSSLSLFHIASLTDIPGCTESKIKITQAKASIELESIENENNLTLLKPELKTTLKPRETFIKPSPAITKDLCLDKIN